MALRRISIDFILIKLIRPPPDSTRLSWFILYLVPWIGVLPLSSRSFLSRDYLPTGDLRSDAPLRHLETSFEFWGVGL